MIGDTSARRDDDVDTKRDEEKNYNNTPSWSGEQSETKRMLRVAVVVVISVFLFGLVVSNQWAAVEAAGDDPLVLDFDEDGIEDPLDALSMAGKWTPVATNSEGAIPQLLLGFSQIACAHLHRQAFKDWGDMGLKLEQ